jgi:hypothetical protein
MTYFLLPTPYNITYLEDLEEYIARPLIRQGKGAAEWDNRNRIIIILPRFEFDLFAVFFDSR